MKNLGKQNHTRFYNVIFPVWLLFIFPLSWLLVIPANFAIDSLIVVLWMYILKLDKKMDVYKKHIIWVFIFGFVADIIGGIMLLITQLIGYEEWFYEYITAPVAMNPFDNIYALLFTFCAVILSGVLIYVFNRFISFRKYKDLKSKRIISLMLAVLTAPYLFLLPTSTLYGSNVECFTNHFVWSDYIQAEVYLNEQPENDILAVESGEHFNYGVVSAFRDGVNTADKVKKEIDGEWEYKVKFFKNGPNAKKMDEILIYKSDDGLYFEYGKATYMIDKDDTEYIYENINEVLNPPAEDVEVKE